MTMRHEDDDSDLRQAFAALRREDADQASPFRAMLAGGAGRRGRRFTPAPGRLVAAAALVAALVGVWAMRGPAPATPPMASMERWTAPTDFLLRTPGREVLETVPRLVYGPSLAVPSSPTENGPPPKRRSMSPGSAPFHWP
jgi:hypothetical protein